MGGVFGGDGSVKWVVKGNRVKSTQTTSKGSVHSHEGVDDTPSGSFTITIKLPTDEAARREFIRQVKQLAADVPDPLRLTLPIEDTAYLKSIGKSASRGNEDQITIDWP